MSGSTHETMLRQSIPRYVNHAHEVVDAIIEKALDEPESRIQVCAFQIGVIGMFAANNELRGFWEERDDLRRPGWGFNVDVPLEDKRLAMSRDYWGRKVWIYDPTRTPTGELGTIEGHWTANDWMNYRSRKEPRAFVTPEFSFRKSEEPDRMYQVNVALCAERAGEFVLGSEKDILKVGADAYRSSMHLSVNEERLLEQKDVHALHIAKVNDILRTLEMVAA